MSEPLAEGRRVRVSRVADNLTPHLVGCAGVVVKVADGAAGYTHGVLLDGSHNPMAFRADELEPEPAPVPRSCVGGEGG